MKVGYYCPLVGQEFFRQIGVHAVDLRKVKYLHKGAVPSEYSADRCDVVFWLSDLLKNNDAPDVLVLTNCCYEQEKLGDSLQSKGGLPVFKLNIPRNTDSVAVTYFAEQLKKLLLWLNEDFPVSYRGQKVKCLNEKLPCLDDGCVPIVLSGISIPQWFDTVLEENFMYPVILDTCGIFYDKNDSRQEPPGNLVKYAEMVLNRGRCFRCSACNASNTVLQKRIQETRPAAALYLANEYCTTAVFRYPYFKELCDKNRVPVYKITIPNWQEPTPQVLEQVELIAKIVKGRDESIF